MFVRPVVNLYRKVNNAGFVFHDLNLVIKFPFVLDMSAAIPAII
jgi:hypothetical protein